MNAEGIFKHYEKDLRRVEAEISKIFKSDVVVIPDIGRHLIGGGGKRLRPMYLLMSSALCGYSGDARYVFAGVIETIHAASLLHDDVVDGAGVRRGKPTSHSIWGAQAVILVGDFLYANSLKMAVSQQNLTTMDAISNAVARMSEGEILQLQKIADPEITEEDYLRIVEGKTGALISASCRIGAILGGLPDNKVNAMASYGLKSGTVFQIYDDILDFKADEGNLGKKLGRDLHEGKITLPLIFLLKSANAQEKDELTAIIDSTSDDDTPDGGGQIERDLQTVLKLFKKYDVIEQTMDKAKEIVAQAKAELSVFDDCKERDDLIVMADYALTRNK
ncbi:MAG: polyprenyl synthetase family protein [Candidatus Magnetominusculus sp. LBB02]|nr:polyprenyl synthetase family protein [Candidatus Magnetominusculus sp. LBB02]